MLPPTPLPIRPKLRDGLITACVTSLVTLLLWLGIASLRAPHYSPDFMAGLKELEARHGQESLDLFQHAMSANPSDPDPYQIICEKATQAKQWPVAVKYAQLGLQNCPQAPPETRLEFYKYLTTGLLEAQKPGWEEAALKAAQEAYGSAPEDPEVMNLYAYTLADVTEDAQSLAQAQDILKKALITLSKMPDTSQVKALRAMTQDSYGWTRCKQNAYPDAIEACNTAIDGITALDPTNETLKIVYYHLGVAQRRSNDLEGARSSLNRALFFDANYRDALNELAKLPQKT